ncbi:hypothetical protein Tco_1236104 [Tanacetum coccineum]
MKPQGRRRPTEETLYLTDAVSYWETTGIKTVDTNIGTKTDKYCVLVQWYSETETESVDANGTSLVGCSNGKVGVAKANGIQVNIDDGDIRCFNSIRKVGSTYRISDISGEPPRKVAANSCEQNKPRIWEMRHDDMSQESGKSLVEMLAAIDLASRSPPLQSKVPRGHAISTSCNVKYPLVQQRIGQNRILQGNLDK